MLTAILLAVMSVNSYAQNYLKTFRSAAFPSRLGSLMLFSGDDGSHGVELWKSDGTSLGTTLVKDIQSGLASSNVSSLFPFNGKVYFSANNGLLGDELWCSDGTAEGTYMVKDIHTSNDVGFNNSSPREFTEWKNDLYFIASNSDSKDVLYKSNGTANGTVPLIDDAYFQASQLTKVSSGLYFTAYDRRQLWYSDGTKTGTKPIDVDDYTIIELLTECSGKLVFVTSETYYKGKFNLYIINYPGSKPVKLHTFEMANYGGVDIDNITPDQEGGFYFSIRSESTEAKDVLWHSDGLPSGTKALYSFPWTKYISQSYIQKFTMFNKALYFMGPDTHTLYVLHSLSSSPKEIVSLQLNPEVTPVQSAGKLYFSSENTLYSFNGSSATKEITHFMRPKSLFDVAGRLYFIYDDYYSKALWTNDSRSKIQISESFSNLANGGSLRFETKPDSMVSRQLTVQNVGNAPLFISDLSVSGRSFYIDKDSLKSLVPGAKFTFNLVYVPIDKQRNEKGYLYIRSNDGGGNDNWRMDLDGNASGNPGLALIPDQIRLKKNLTMPDSTTDFLLTNNRIQRLSDNDIEVGLFIFPGEKKSTYKLVQGDGDLDNDGFYINSNKLILKRGYSEQSTLTVRVQALSGQVIAERYFLITQVKNQRNLSSGDCVNNIRQISYRLNDVAVMNNAFIAIGSSGKLILSEDQGNTWQNISTGISEDLASIQVVSGTTAYILGQHGSLLKSEDGAKTWFPTTRPLTSYFNRKPMFFPSAEIGYILNDQSIFKTRDGGKRWQKFEYQTSSRFSDVYFINDQEGYICGSDKLLLHTTNGGETWKEIKVEILGEYTHFSSVTFHERNTGYITTSNGELIKTKDGGKTWNRYSVLPAQGGKLVFSDREPAWLLSLGTLFKSKDKGINWTIDTVSDFNALVYNPKIDTWCAVGSGGSYGSGYGQSISLKKSDQQWQSRSKIGDSNILVTKMFPSGTGFAFGSESYKTLDNGITWKKMPVFKGWTPIQNAAMIDERTGFYAETYKIYKTSDGGESWSENFFDYSAPVSALYFFNTQLGFYKTSNALYRTNSAGKLWTKVDSSLGTQGQFQFLDAAHGYCLNFGSGAQILATSDSGKTWSIIHVRDEMFVKSMYFINKSIGFVGGGRGELLKTTDSGRSWSPIYTEMTSFLWSIKFTDEKHGYILHTNNNGYSAIHESIDGGQNWKIIYTINKTLSDISVSGNGFIVSGEGGELFEISRDPVKPANTGYIVGDEVVLAGSKNAFSLPDVEGTSYRWSFSGGPRLEYFDNHAVATWTKPGTYKIEAVSYNMCRSGDSRSFSVIVKDMEEPEIFGPDSVYSYAKNVRYKTVDRTQITYQWAASPSTSISTNTNSVSINWSTGKIGFVTLTATDNILRIKKRAVKDVLFLQKPGLIPEDNIKLSIGSVTCRGNSDGKLNIKAEQPSRYTATLSGSDGLVATHNFADQLSISNLSPGTYQVTISDNDNLDYTRQFSFQINEPQLITVATSYQADNDMIHLRMSGGQKYFVEVNGKIYESESGILSIPALHESVRIKAYTEKPCQGIYEEFVGRNPISVFPNPVSNKINVNLSNVPQKSLSLRLYNATGLILLDRKEKLNKDISIDVSSFRPSFYFLRIYVDGKVFNTKIIKSE